MTTVGADRADETFVCRDDVVRAAVYRAWDSCRKRDSAGCREAVAQVVTVHRLWPLVVAREAILDAEREYERRVQLVEERPWLIHDYFDLDAENGLVA